MKVSKVLKVTPVVSAVVALTCTAMHTTLTCISVIAASANEKVKENCY